MRISARLLSLVAGSAATALGCGGVQTLPPRVPAQVAVAPAPAQPPSVNVNAPGEPTVPLYSDPEDLAAAACGRG